MKTSEQEKETIQNKLREATLPIEFKNYRELCKFFDFKPTGGDSKIKRLKHIEYIAITETCKQKIIVYSLKNNVGNNDICKNGKEIIIEEFRRLYKFKKDVIVTGYNGLAKLFGFINNNFSDKKSNGFTNKFNEQFLKIENYDEKLGKLLYNSIVSKYKYYINKVLKEMQNDEVILIEHAWYKTSLEFKNENEIEFEDSEFIFQSNNTFTKCSWHESAILNTIKENVLKQLSCKDIHEVYQKKQDKKFYKEFRTKMLKTINTTAYEMMEITYIEENGGLDAEPFKEERYTTLQKENNKLFKASYFTHQEEKINKSKCALGLEYFTILLEDGVETLQVYPKEKGMYIENDEICSYDDLCEEIPTEKAIEQNQIALLSQKEQLKKTLDIVCTIRKS